MSDGGVAELMALFGTDPQLKAQLAIQAARRAQQRALAGGDQIGLEVATVHLDHALDHYAALTRAETATAAR